MGHTVHLETCTIADFYLQLHPAEQRIAQHFSSTKRIQEFSSARRVATLAAKQLGFLCLPLGKGPRGEPLWPPGVVATLAHDNQIAGCLMAKRNSDLISVGLDFESSRRKIDHKIFPMLFSAAEITLFSSLPNEVPLAGFCIKEAIYKCLYPVTSISLKFHDIVINHIDHHFFTASCIRQLQTGTTSINKKIEGKIRINHNRIYAAVLLKGDGQWSLA